MDKYLNVEEWEKWLSDGGCLICQDHELTKVIPINIGVGVILNEEYDAKENEQWVSTRNFSGRDKDYLKTVTLDITTFAGYGGVHFYGKLRASCPEFVCDSLPNYSKTIGGYGVPKFLNDISIELTSVVTQERIDSDILSRTNTWEDYHVGSHTYRFDTMDDIIKRGKEIFLKWFDPEWKLMIKRPYSWETEKVVFIKDEK